VNHRKTEERLGKTEIVNYNPFPTFEENLGSRRVRDPSPDFDHCSCKIFAWPPAPDPKLQVTQFYLKTPRCWWKQLVLPTIFSSHLMVRVYTMSIWFVKRWKQIGDVISLNSHFESHYIYFYNHRSRPSDFYTDLGNSTLSWQNNPFLFSNLI
jgi:hypothetical protein